MSLPNERTPVSGIIVLKVQNHFSENQKYRTFKHFRDFELSYLVISLLNG
jgi:hypothetical protein